MNQHTIQSGQDAPRPPDFVIVGAQKCGTTSLHRALDMHPQVLMPSPKELNFFHDDGSYSRGVNLYTFHFAACPPRHVVGEASACSPVPHDGEQRDEQ
jgi:hypothetical protein